MHRFVWLALAAAACGRTGPGPYSIQVTVVGAPAMIAYRDSGGVWRDAGAGELPGNYVLDVHGAYTLALTCSDMTGFDTVVQSRTVDDGDSLFVYCDGHSTALPSSNHITGQMLQPGSVSMYDFQQSLTAPWSFSLAVPPNASELVAIGNGKALIERDLQAPGQLPLLPIDIDRAGTPLQSVPLALDGMIGQESITTEVDLYGPDNVAFGPVVEGTTAQALPSSLLASNDLLDLYITTTTADGRFSRAVDSWFDGPQTQFTLMPTLDGVTIDGATATWSALPPHTAVSLDLVTQSATTYSAERISATQAWLDATGTTELALPTDMPRRFQQAWTIDPSSVHDASFTAVDDSTDVAYSSTVNVASSMARAAGSSRTRPHLPRRSAGR